MSEGDCPLRQLRNIQTQQWPVHLQYARPADITEQTFIKATTAASVSVALYPISGGHCFCVAAQKVQKSP